MKKKSTLLLCALLAICLPAMAVFSGVDLSATLKNLRQELQRDYLKISLTREKLTGKYEKQHQKMVEIIKDCVPAVRCAYCLGRCINASVSARINWNRLTLTQSIQ